MFKHRLSVTTTQMPRHWRQFVIGNKREGQMAKKQQQQPQSDVEKKDIPQYLLTFDIFLYVFHILIIDSTLKVLAMCSYPSFSIEPLPSATTINGLHILWKTYEQSNSTS